MTGRLSPVAVHSVVDDHSRLASAESLPDETGDTCVSFSARLHAFFAGRGIDTQAVMTDDAFAHTRSGTFRHTREDHSVKHARIRPRRPWTNGTLERFNCTLLEEWACVRTSRSDNARSRTFDRFVLNYNKWHPTRHSAADHPGPASTTPRGIPPRLPTCHPGSPTVP
jgi:hypothetical protein